MHSPQADSPVFSLAEALAMLERTPAVLSALLDHLPPAWHHTNYAPDTFSPFDVVGHLITGERTDWLPRVRIIMQLGESTPFAPYDRYAQFEASAGQTMHDLLATFAQLRSTNVTAVRAMHITDADLTRTGTHPALGRVTLQNLLATWVVHDINHTAQICRGLAARYQPVVGPWREYLGIYKAPVTTMDATGAARKAKA